MERQHATGPVRTEPGSLGAGCLIQIAPQIRILVAVEPIDARKYAPSIDMRSHNGADPPYRPSGGLGTAHNGRYV